MTDKQRKWVDEYLATHDVQEMRMTRDTYDAMLELARKEMVKEIINFIESLKVKEDGIHQWRENHNDTIDKVLLKLNGKFVNGTEV